MSYDPAPAAAVLWRTRQDRGVVMPLPASIAPRDEVEGAAAQLALARLAGAVPCAGFKIGATGKRMQEYLGLNGPAGRLHGTPERLSGTMAKFVSPIASSPVWSVRSRSDSRTTCRRVLIPPKRSPRRWASSSPASKSSRTVMIT